MAVLTTEITIIPTGGALGAIVTGLDTRRSIPGSVILQLKQALQDHHILIFKQQTLTEEQLFEFATHFGDVFIPPSDVPVLGSVAGQVPRVVTIANAPEYGAGKGLLDNIELLPHIDHLWTPRPSSGSLLYALEVPRQGGDTQWANLAWAYEDLDGATKAEIADLRVINYNPFLKDPGNGTIRGSYNFPGTYQPEQLLSAHPLVRTHPDSGKKILFLDCSNEVEIVGVSPEKGAALIERLHQHLKQPKFYYNHRWSVGDIVYWDNQSTMHCRPAFDPHERRIMKRVSLAGSRPF